MADSTASNESKTLFSSEVDLKQKEFIHGSCKYNRILPASDGQTRTLSLTGETEVDFTIPLKVMNLSRSILYYTYNAADPTGTLTNKHHMGCLANIKTIALYSDSGVFLCNIKFCANYTKVIFPVTHKHDEYMSNNRMHSTQVVTGARSSGYLFNPSNEKSSEAMVANAPTGRILTHAGAIVDGSSSYTGIQLLNSGAQGEASGYQISLPLSKLKHSILAVDKNFYFGEKLTLKVTFAQQKKMGFAALIVADADTPTPFTVAGSISNLALYHAVETNSNIITQMINRYKKGYKEIIPFVYGFRSALAVGTSSNIERNLNSAHGQRLLRIYSSNFHTTEINHTALNNNNTANAKVVSFKTSLDGDDLQTMDLKCVDNDDWTYLQDKISGCAFSNSDEFKTLQIWLDSWDGVKSWDCSMDHVKNGISLVNGLKYGVNQITANIALNHYTFAVTQKTLSVSDGIMSVL